MVLGSSPSPGATRTRLGAGALGYLQRMRFKLGYATGFATGYYLGTKAGRQRYDQLNRTLRKLWRSDAAENVVEKLTGKAKGTVAQVLPHRSNGHANAPSSVGVAADGSPNGTATVPGVVMAPAPADPVGPSTPSPTTPYSSSR